MDTPLTIRVDDASGAPTVELLRLHAEGMEANSPPGACHYFDVADFQRPDVTLWTAWFAGIGDAEQLAGCAALVELDGEHGEIKSMRKAPAALGRGVGRAMLDHIIAVARERGYRRLSLETGRGPSFDAAITLYESSGFTECGPFADYVESDFSRYFTMPLDH